MRSIIILILSVIPLFQSYGQDVIYLDVDGNKIKKKTFLANWRNKDMALSRWDSIDKNNQRYAKLTEFIYEFGTFDYEKVKDEIEIITDLTVPDSSIIFINYTFKDDLCSKRSSNYWPREYINSRKKWFSQYKVKLRKNGIFYIWLFEKGITLNTKKNKKKEYLFIDENNFFREKFFTNQTLCGSSGLIKPNGQVLVSKGEGSPNQLLHALKPQNWSLFFKSKD